METTNTTTATGLTTATTTTGLTNITTTDTTNTTTNTTATGLTCPEQQPDSLWVVLYLACSVAATVLVLVSALLVWVVARARAMVAGRPPLGYIDIPSSVSTRSSLSSGAAGDIGDLRNDYELLPEMYLEQKQQQVRPKVRFKSGQEEPSGGPTAEEDQLDVDRLHGAVFNTSSIFKESSSSPSDESVKSNNGQPPRINNLLEDVFRISGSVATVTGGRGQQHNRRRRDSAAPLAPSNHRRGSVAAQGAGARRASILAGSGNYDLGRRRKTVGFNMELSEDLER